MVSNDQRWYLWVSLLFSLCQTLIKATLEEHRQHITSFNVIHGGCRGCFLFRRRTLGASGGLVPVGAAVGTLHLLAQTAGLLFQARLDLTAALRPGVDTQYKKIETRGPKANKHAGLFLVSLSSDIAQRHVHTKEGGY